MKRHLFFAVASLVVCAAACGDEGRGPTVSEEFAVDGGPAPSRDGSVVPLGVSAANSRFRGVNLAGLEFAGGTIPGVAGTNYFTPPHTLIDYYASKKVTLLRLPFLWRRLQPTEKGPLDTAYLALLSDVVTYATSKHIAVLLDLHDYGRYLGKTLGDQVAPAVFADLWGKIAAVYRGNDHVFFGLMNEPHDQDAKAWLAAVNPAIAAIRGAGATNIVSVPGVSWASADHWVSSGSAAAMIQVVDPANNYVYELHQYLDSDASGSHDTCVSTTVGSTRLAEFTAWAKAHGKRGLLGEFAGGRNATCAAALEDQVAYMEAHADVWFGWTYWAGGAAWPESYPFALDPVNGADRPQMAVLAKHL